MTSRRGLHTFICSLLTSALIAAAPPSQAGDLELGMQLLENGQAEQAIEVWRPLAKSGDADAQFGLGVIYNDAMGVPQDYNEANYWFLRAAEQGYVPAQYNLGNAYKYGTGMPQDPALAVIWWRKAAEQGFGPAQYNLGTAYLEGVGVARDEAAGLAWYRRAAANGHPYAQVYLDEHASKRSPDAAAAEPATSTTNPVIPAPERQPETPAPVAAQANSNDAVPTNRAPANDASSEPAVAMNESPDVPAATAQQAATDTSPLPSPKNCDDWLQQGPDNGYSIQLMANRKLDSSAQFIHQHKLQDTIVCSYSVKGRLWYAVFYGQYPSAAAARAALAGLSAEVRAGGAYPRRLKEIRRAVETTSD